MAESRDTRTFFAKGTVDEWNYVLSIYKEAVKLKAQKKNKKPEELLKLDNWYQEELPSLIGARKEKHVTHDELVMIMKWKLARGKFYPQLQNLVKINTPRMVLQATKKAYKKLPNLTTAIQSLTILKGVGPSMASAVLAAGAPDMASFMADECLLSIPDVESLDYTVQEYLNFSQKIQNVVDRLNKSDKNGGGTWSPHRVELALWAHYVASEYNPSLLADMPVPTAEENTHNGKGHETNHEQSDATQGIKTDGNDVTDNNDVITKPDDELTRDGQDTDTEAVTPPPASDKPAESDTNDTTSSGDGVSGQDEDTSKDSESPRDETRDSNDQPPPKKAKLEDD